MFFFCGAWPLGYSFGGFSGILMSLWQFAVVFLAGFTSFVWPLGSLMEFGLCGVVLISWSHGFMGVVETSTFPVLVAITKP